jgi:tetratricopeptide (TPR) repeat protein
MKKNEIKLEANQHFKKANYQKAIELFTIAIDLKDEFNEDIDHLLYSNRSLCYFQLNQFQKASEDSLKVIGITLYYLIDNKQIYQKIGIKVYT